MKEESWSFELVAAGRRIPDAGLLIRRQLGLTSPPEVWGARFYDLPSGDRCAVSADDLLAASALGVRITRESLSAFERARPRLDAALRQLPHSVSLADADDATIETISATVLDSGMDATVTAKILHRLRPRLVPPFDRATTDWYATGVGNRDAGRPPALFAHMRDDLRRSENREALRGLQWAIAADADGGLVPTHVRLLDIALWMAARSTT